MSIPRSPKTSFLVHQVRGRGTFGPGELSCGGNNLLQSYSLEKVFYSEKDLRESYDQQISALRPRSHAPMICSRANFNSSIRSSSLSIPATILMSQSNRYIFSRTSTRAGALRS